jgi:hypothetical protein
MVQVDAKVSGAVAPDTRHSTAGARYHPLVVPSCGSAIRGIARDALWIVRQQIAG